MKWREYWEREQWEGAQKREGEGERVGKGGKKNRKERVGGSEGRERLSADLEPPSNQKV